MMKFLEIKTPVFLSCLWNIPPQFQQNKHNTFYLLHQNKFQTSHVAPKFSKLTLAFGQQYSKLAL
jgi:hypothetical protein